MMHAINLKDEIFQELKETCLAAFESKKKYTVEELMMEMMDHPEVPMHYPYHHFIIPATLLTLATMEDCSSKEELEEMLDKAILRAKNVLGGFCGHYGACGAGVGAGIFMSIYTDTSPLSETGWQWANEMTGICLQKIASIPGPRCCKRTGFLAMQTAVPYANEKLELHLTSGDKIVCKYASRNKDCKKEVCPFYPGEK